MNDFLTDPARFNIHATSARLLADAAAREGTRRPTIRVTDNDRREDNDR